MCRRVQERVQVRAQRCFLIILILATKLINSCTLCSLRSMPRTIYYSSTHIMLSSAVVSKDDGNFVDKKVCRCSQANSLRKYIDIMILDHLSMLRVRCLEIKYAVAANSTFFPLSHCLAYIVRPNFVIQEQPFQLKVRGNEKKNNRPPRSHDSRPSEERRLLIEECMFT